MTHLLALAKVLLLLAVSTSVCLSQRTAIITVSKTAVYSEKDIDSKVVGFVGEGEKVEIVAVTGKWANIIVTKSINGWTFLDDIRILPSKLEISQCEQKLANLPKIRGIRISMTVPEIAELLGISVSEIKMVRRPRPVASSADEILELPFDEVSIPTERMPVAHRDGLIDITLRFVLGRVTEFVVRYDKSIEWTKTRELTSRLNEIYGLPSSVWFGGVAICGKFKMIVSINQSQVSKVGSAITVTKSAASIAAEVRNARLQKQREFKP